MPKTLKREDPLHIPMEFDALLTGIVRDVPAGPAPSIQVWEGDCTAKLGDIADNSVHLILTDPPYFLDGLDNGWKKGTNGKRTANTAVGKLPVGMKFDKQQGIDLYNFMLPVCRELNRILVPGGFFVCFSQPRLVHRMALAAEDAGFEIRDLLAWRFKARAQMKAFTMNHFVEKMDIPDAEKSRMIQSMGGRRTPQFRPQFEAVLLAQKPREGTFVENWMKYRAGLIDASRGLENGTPVAGTVPTTVMEVEKPVESERYGEHLTPKPVPLLRHLIEVLTLPGQMVVDPFLGSGSTCVAAQATGRECIGIEINPDYATIARSRIGKESRLGIIGEG